MMEREFVSFELKENEKPFNIRHRCYYFSKEILLFVKDCEYDRVYASLFDQLIRSATSIGANIVEGKAGSSKKDWKKVSLPLLVRCFALLALLLNLTNFSALAHDRRHESVRALAQFVELG